MAKHSVQSRCFTKEVEEEVLELLYIIHQVGRLRFIKSRIDFDKAAIDVSSFMPGQAYVALSRLRSLEGLILLSPLRMNGISNDQDVMDYALNKASEELLKNSLHFETKILFIIIINSFDWHDLAQEWRNHKFSYGDKTENTTKSNMPIGLQNNWMRSKAFWTHPKNSYTN
jgi:hypothetical protein